MLVLLWATVMALLMVIALNRLNLAPDTAYGWMSPDRLNAGRQFFSIFTQWDGDWYIRLAMQGYVFDPNGLSTVAFLPLYPLLLRLVVFVTQSYVTAAWVINGISLVGALYFFQKLAREEGLTKDEGDMATAFLLVYPTVIFIFLYTPRRCFFF